ncbi:hypothetical protein [Acidovorax sp. Q11]
MNNMQFDQATQTYRGAVGPYLISEDSLAFGTHKPLQLPLDWAPQSYLDGLSTYWQDQALRGVWESVFTKPHLLAQPPGGQDALVQQLVQAMAGFAAPAMGQVEASLGQLVNAFQMWGVDAGA